MVPHQNTARSKRFSRRSIPLARAVVATLVLITTAVIGISSAALAHEIGDSAGPTMFHECRHSDGCQSAGSLGFHDCRHTDGCQSAGSLGFHDCRHTDGCQSAGSLGFHDCRHTDGCQSAGSLGFHECHTDGCHSDDQLHSSPRHQCDDAAAAAGVLRPVVAFHPHHGDCHEHAVGPVS